MKNPFKKQPTIDNIDASDIDTSTESVKSSKRFLGRSKTKKTDAQKVPTPVDKKGPTIETHGFDYSESEDAYETNGNVNNENAAVINPYDYNETDDGASSATSPYTAFNDSNWYSLNGRISRVKFLAYGMIWGLLLTLLILILILLSGGLIALAMQGGMGGSIMSLPVIIIALCMIPILVFSMVLLPRRRLHDIGKSGWWLLLYFIPLASLVLLYWIYLKQGDEGVNEYGLPSRPNTTVENVFASIAAIITVFSFLAVLITPIFADATPDTMASDDEFSEDLESLNSEPLDPEMTISEGEAESNDADLIINDDIIDNQPSDANEVQLNTNEQLDPEVQAEIDAALGRTNEPTETTTPASPSNQKSTSYEDFLRASETPILVEKEAPANDTATTVNEGNNETVDETAP